MGLLGVHLGSLQGALGVLFGSMLGDICMFFGRSTSIGGPSVFYRGSIGFLFQILFFGCLLFILYLPNTSFSTLFVRVYR